MCITTTTTKVSRQKRSLYYQFQQCDSTCGALQAPLVKKELGRKGRKEEEVRIPYPKVYNF